MQKAIQTKHDAYRIGGSAAVAATKIAIRGNPLVPATGVLTSALGVEMDQVDDEQLGEKEIAQMREHMKKLKQELQDRVDPRPSSRKGCTW